MWTRELSYTAESEMFGALRYEVFSMQLGWVLGDRVRKIELDQLDPTAHHIGVFDRANTLVGYSRIIQGGQPGGVLCEQPAFAALLPLGIAFTSDTAEVSRMCVRPEYQRKSRRGGLVITIALFRAIHEYCLSRGVHLLYAVADDKDERNYNHKAFLMRLLPFTAISGPVYLDAKGGSWLLQLDVPAAAQLPAVKKLLNL